MSTYVGIIRLINMKKSVFPWNMELEKLKLWKQITVYKRIRLLAVKFHNISRNIYSKTRLFFVHFNSFNFDQNSLATLKSHYLVHSNEKNFYCEICGRAFKHYYNVITHSKKFHSKEPFEPRTALPSGRSCSPGRYSPGIYCSNA